MYKLHIPYVSPPEGDMVRVLEEVGGVSGVALTQGQQPVGQMDVIQNPDC